MSRLLTMLAFALIALPSFAADPFSVQDFIGNWDGRDITSLNDDITADDIHLLVTATEGGFRLSWKDLKLDQRNTTDDTIIDAGFVRTERAGVFEFAPEGRSFINRMFASPSSGNPLEGDTLLWARLNADILNVYSLDIDKDGGFALNHTTLTKVEDGLHLRFRQRSHDLGDRVVVEGLLALAGG